MTKMRARILSSVVLVLASVSPQMKAADGETASAPRDKPNTKAWEKNRDEGRKALIAGKVAEAGPLLEAALTEAEKFAPKDGRLAESATDLASYRATTKDYEGAETLLRRALGIRREGADHLAEGSCLFDIARICVLLKKYDEAEKSLLEARDIFDRKLGADHPMDAVCRFYLAELYQTQHDFARAEQLFKEVKELSLHPATRVKMQQTDPALYGVRTMRSTFRSNDELAFEALNHLAQIYLQQDLPDKAEASLKEAVKVAEESRGDNTAGLQVALGNLGGFYLVRTNHPQAIATFERLERSQEEAHGTKDPATRKTAATLGKLYDSEAKAGDSEALYKKAMEIREKFENPESELTLVATGELAAFYMRHEQYSQAASLYEREWSRAEKVRSDDLRELPMLGQLAVIYTKLERDSALERVYKEQIAIYEKTFGPNHNALLKPMENYAALLRKERKDAEAADLESRIKTIRGPGK